MGVSPARARPLRRPLHTCASWNCAPAAIPAAKRAWPAAACACPTSPRRKRGGNWRPCAPPPGMERKEKIMHIDTQTTPMRVEIEGREYPLAPHGAPGGKTAARRGSGPARGQAAPQSGNGATLVAAGPQGRARIVPARRRGRPRPPRRHLLRCSRRAGSAGARKARGTHAGAGRGTARDLAEAIRPLLELAALLRGGASEEKTEA